MWESGLQLGFAHSRIVADVEGQQILVLKYLRMKIAIFLSNVGWEIRSLADNDVT